MLNNTCLKSISWGSSPNLIVINLNRCWRMRGLLFFALLMGLWAFQASDALAESVRVDSNNDWYHLTRSAQVLTEAKSFTEVVSSSNWESVDAHLTTSSLNRDSSYWLKIPITIDALDQGNNKWVIRAYGEKQLAHTVFLKNSHTDLVSSLLMETNGSSDAVSSVFRSGQ